MATGNSTIKVNIIGDAKGLQKELGKAEKGIAGLAGSTKGLLIGGAIGGAIAGIAKFGATAIEEADRLGDATTRLEISLGDLAGPLADAADGYSNLGQSAQDILELEAAFADTATTLGVATPLIADFADDAAATAAAVALLGEQDAATVIDLIGKAAGGSQRAMRELGIFVDESAVAARALADTGKPTVDALTDSELAAARYKEVLEKLAPKLAAVTQGGLDAADASAVFDAKLETLTGKIGGHLEGPLNDLTSWILTGVEGWEMFAANTDEAIAAVKRALGPFGELAGLLGTIGDALDPRAFGASIRNAINDTYGLGEGDTGGGRSSGSGGGFGPSAPPVTIVVQPNAAAEVERSVINALRDHNRRNGVLP